MPTVSDFIFDDTIERGYIAADDGGLHGPLSFEFRPLRVAEVARVVSLASNRSITIDDVHAAMQKAVATSLKSWSIRGRDENVPAITPENAGRIKPALWDKLWLILIGERASDHNPDATAA
jgi:hypothetical protein